MHKGRMASHLAIVKKKKKTQNEQPIFSTFDLINNQDIIINTKEVFGCGESESRESLLNWE